MEFVLHAVVVTELLNDHALLDILGPGTTNTFDGTVNRPEYAFDVVYVM